MKIGGYNMPHLFNEDKSLFNVQKVTAQSLVSFNDITIGAQGSSSQSHYYRGDSLYQNGYTPQGVIGFHAETDRVLLGDFYISGSSMYAKFYNLSNTSVTCKCELYILWTKS